MYGHESPNKTNSGNSSRFVSRLGNSTISLSSSGVATSLGDDVTSAVDDEDGEEEEDCVTSEDDDRLLLLAVESLLLLLFSSSQTLVGAEGTMLKSIDAAFAAAAWTSRGELEAGRGRDPASLGKLRMAELPLMLKAATSWARAAISGVEKVPSQIRFFFLGSRISDTHFPHVRIRTPLNTGCLLLLLVLSLGLFGFLGFSSGSGLDTGFGDNPDEDGEDRACKEEE